MILSLVVAASVAEKCAPRVARETILSVAYHESRFDTLAIGDNTARKSIHPKSRMDAVTIAQDLIARGHSIDMGIGQVNNRTAARLAAPTSSPAHCSRVRSSIASGAASLCQHRCSKPSMFLVWVAAPGWHRMAATLPFAWSTWCSSASWPASTFFLACRLRSKHPRSRSAPNRFASIGAIGGLRIDRCPSAFRG